MSCFYSLLQRLLLGCMRASQRLSVYIPDDMQCDTEPPRGVATPKRYCDGGGGYCRGLSDPKIRSVSKGKIRPFRYTLRNTFGNCVGKLLAIYSKVLAKFLEFSANGLQVNTDFVINTLNNPRQCIKNALTCDKNTRLGMAVCFFISYI